MSRRRAQPAASGGHLLSNYMLTARFVGAADRDAAAAKLDTSKDGAFVVRESTTRPGEYALAVVHAGAIKHLKIDGSAVTRRPLSCLHCNSCVIYGKF